MDLSTEELPAHISTRDSDTVDGTLDAPADDASLSHEIETAQNLCGRRVDARRMAARLSALSGHRLTDDVSAKRDAERAERDAAARARLCQAEMGVDDKLPSLSSNKKRPHSSTVRFLAEMLGTSPSTVVWNSLTMSLPKVEILRMVRDAQTAPNPASEWAKQIADLEPRAPSCRRHGTTHVYYAPGTNITPYIYGMRPNSKQSQNEAASQWMIAAEKGKLTNRICRCELTGLTLVERGTKGGAKYWVLNKDFHGMGIEAAREMVAVAAILAGIMPGAINGAIPEIAKKLAVDGDAWTGLAIATRHPIFYNVAQAMVKLRDSAYWQKEDTDMRANLQAWARAAEKKM